MAKGSADLLASFAKRPLPVKLGVLGVVLVILGGLYWQVFYSAIAEEKKALEQKRKKDTAEEKRLKQREKEWVLLLQQKELLDEQLRKNRVTLPTSAELASFLAHLQKQAAGAGVSIKRFSRTAESTVESYVRVPVQMEIVGTFYQINNYFRLLSKTERIITVGNLWIGGGKLKNNELILSAKFAATTFRQKDRPPDTSVGKSVDKSKKAGKDAKKKGDGKDAKKGDGKDAKKGDGKDAKKADGKPKGDVKKGMNRLTKPGAGAATGGAQ